MSDANHQQQSSFRLGTTPIAALAGWSLVAVGLCMPIAVMVLAHAAPGFAGSISSRGYVISLVAVIWLLVQRRSMGADKRGRVTLVVGAIVLAAGGWSSYRILVNAKVDREIAAARPEINAILEAAREEATLVASGQLAPAGISEQWQPYATALQPIDLADDAIALRTRFVELTRRSRLRELGMAKEFHQRLNELGISSSMEPESLMDPKARAASLKSLTQYRSLLDWYEREHPDLTDAGERDIKVLGLPSEGEKEMIAGLNRRAAAEAPGIQAFLGGERRFADLAEQLIKFVEARSAMIRLSNGELAFDEDADQVEYHSKLTEIASLAMN